MSAHTAAFSQVQDMFWLAHLQGDGEAAHISNTPWAKPSQSQILSAGSPDNPTNTKIHDCFEVTKFCSDFDTLLR